MEEPRSCRRCGKCCFVDLTANAEQEDFERWQAENRQDILNIINNRHLTWAGDRMVSTESGDTLRKCYFLYSKGMSGFAPYTRQDPRFAGSISRVLRNCVQNGRSRSGAEDRRLRNSGRRL